MAKKTAEKPVEDVSITLEVVCAQIEKQHFVMLGRSENGAFNKAEAWNAAETVAVGAKSIEQILSEAGVDTDGEKFLLTFSPNTGELMAAKQV